MQHVPHGEIDAIDRESIKRCQRCNKVIAVERRVKQEPPF